MSCRSASSHIARGGLAISLLILGVPAAPATPSEAAQEEVSDEPRFLPMPQEFDATADQALFNEIVDKLNEPEARSRMLPYLDETLAKLRQPTKLRGMVQFWRAGWLMAGEKFPAAADAVEESVRLLPGYSGPLIVAASAYAYSNRPDKGTDFFLRAAEIDPETVRKIDDYEVNNLMQRLKVARDNRRARALSDRLLDIGWVGSTLDSRSNLARTAIEGRMDDGDVAGARSLIPKLLVPEHSYELLLDKKYATIWPDLETWGGEGLETQWATYLREARARWAPTKDPVAIRAYVGALRTAGHNRTIIRDILPRYYGKLDPMADLELQFAVTGVAQALAAEGRWDDVDQLFQRAQDVWPLKKENVNSLNIAGNWAHYLLLAGKYEQSLRKMDVAIDLATRWQVNPDAIATMHHYRACALHELGRTSQTAVSTAIASSIGFPAESAELHLCTGSRATALRVLVEGLKSDASRANVLKFMQKDTLRPADSDYARRMHAEIMQLRSDPALVAEVERYGRILPFSESEGAPAEGQTTQ